MFVFGHLGIGRALVDRLRPGLPGLWVFLGTALPDLIDKPLYYGLVFATDHHGADLGLISGTRTFGHSGIVLLVLIFTAALARRPAVWAIVLGVLTHLGLDLLGDLLSAQPDTTSSTIDALVFPLRGWQFHVFDSWSMLDHFQLLVTNSYVNVGEVLGALLLWQHFRGGRRRRSDADRPLESAS